MQNDILARAVERPLSRRREAAAHDVAALIKAGLDLFSRQGGLDPKVSDIVREAGLSNQAFYRHFQSKDELLVAILGEGRRALLAFLERRMAEETEPAARVRAWVAGVLAQARNPKAAAATAPFAANASRLARDFPAEVAASSAALKAPLVEALTDLGSPAAERDAEAIYLLAFGAMERALIAGTRPSDDEMEHVVGFALRGVAAP